MICFFFDIYHDRTNIFFAFSAPSRLFCLKIISIGARCNEEERGDTNFYILFILRVYSYLRVPGALHIDYTRTHRRLKSEERG